MSNSKLRLSATDKKIAGVCAGVAEFFGIDVTLVRIIWLAAVLLCGSGLFAYLICWIVMPKQELPIQQ